MSRPPACDYVELRCRSAFSFLEASANPEDLVAAAAERGHGALALADRDGLYGIPRFHAAARGLGLRPIVGAELRVQTDENGAANLLLLVETPRGYRNLARLITCGHARASCAQRAQVSRSEPQASEDHRVGSEAKPSGQRASPIGSH